MRRLLLLVLVASAVPAIAADDREVAPKPRVAIDLTGFKTVKELVKADPKAFRLTSESTAVAGFIGVEIGQDAQARPIIEDVAPDSPAEAAGLKSGDVVTHVGGSPVSEATAVRNRLRSAFAGEPLALGVIQGGKPVAYTVTPRPASKPMTAAAPGSRSRVTLGIRNEQRSRGEVEVSELTEGGAAAEAGVKVGDVILKVDDTALTEEVSLRDVLEKKSAGDAVVLTIKRKDQEVELRARLKAETFGGGRGGRFGGGGWDDRLPRAWTRPSYKLAIVGIEYPDVKHNPKITDKDWEASMFSLGKYTDRSATGQKVHGSMADYYNEISYGKFKIEGSFVGWVEVSKKRTEYSSGTGTSFREKTALLVEALDKLVKKDKDALKDFDGIFFLYAGGRVQTTRGGLYWPHRASVTHQGKRWPYFIVQEGGSRMTDISVFCHEFGHLLGLPDLYARPEVPGMEGVGSWCAMSQQAGGGRPQHFSAWSKDQLGWLKPTIIDPRIKQKVILGSITDSPEECLKVMLKADGSEYLLLENRKKKGFDESLPAEGLLIWRVIPGNSTQRVFLEESHGVAGPGGPRQFPSAVPFPSQANNSFTPYTTPSSKSQTGGGLDCYITNIRKLPDGRVTFHIGYEYQ